MLDRRWIAAAAALLVLGAGCSSDDDADAEDRDAASIADPVRVLPATDAGRSDDHAPSQTPNDGEADGGDADADTLATDGGRRGAASATDAGLEGTPDTGAPSEMDASSDGMVADAGGVSDAGAQDPTDAGPDAALDVGGPMYIVDPDFTLPPLSGPAPTLPPVQGECPVFVNGDTIAVAGHASIAILAGEPNKGGALLFYWHGTGGSAIEALYALPQLVLEEVFFSGGIIAAFNGDESSRAGGDCSGSRAHNIADFEAADQIAACAVQNHGVDPRRIYTTGCSAGGLQSGCMTQRRSSYLAASAPNSGGVLSSQAWQDDHAPAVFTMHGGADDRVGVSFASTSRSLDQSAKNHGSFVVNCDHGGGHCLAPPELQIAAWQFMKDHPWGVAASPWANGLPDGVPDYCTVF